MEGKDLKPPGSDPQDQPTIDSVPSPAPSVLRVGQTLSHYRILEKIGAGGMGEVYLAEDTRLGRKVALKVLPPAFSSDPDRVARFQREARAAAALNHPHIAAVYDAGAVNNTLFIVEEYLEGETLRQALAGGRLPLKRLLELGIEIAEALATAHAVGIAHRDLKPENVFVTKEGRAKILDFGLAKQLDPALPVDAAAPTLSQSPGPFRTAAGQLLGTIGYMAPEQVEGRPVDHRADLFAFGCVLYEMLSGRPPFAGRSGIETLHRILHEEPPPIGNARPHLPGESLRLLDKCLAKDPADRYQHAADLVVDLRRLRRELEAGAAMPARTAPAADAARRPARLAIVLPPGAPLALGERPALALSPDGSQLVYVARRGAATQLYSRAMDRPEPVPLAGTEGGTGPFFSPDGQWVGFFAGGKLKKVALTGGAPLMLGEAPDSRGASWGPDDHIIFAPAQATGLWRIAAAGGAPRVLTTPDLEQGEVTHRWPEVLPDGKSVLFTIGTAGSPSYDDARIAVQSLETGRRRILVEGGAHARYAPTGHVLFIRAATLFALPFDPTRLEETATVLPILEGVATEATGASQWAFSGNGSLVYVSGGKRATARALVWVDRKGTARPLPAPARMFEEPRLAPDGRRLAVGVRAAHSDIWMYDIKRGTLTRLTFEADNFAPIWTPNGRRIAFSSNRAGASNIFWVAADGAGAAEKLLESEYDQVPGCWSPDGRILAFTEFHPDTGAGIWTLEPKSRRAPRPFFRTPSNAWGPMFSPDGRWLAYASDESGRAEVYVQAFPGASQKWQISTEGGAEPVWAPNGRELFYRQDDRVMAASLQTKPAFAAAKPRPLFAGPYLRASAVYLPAYDVARDGRRFLMVEESGDQAEQQHLHIVLDWFAELPGRA